MVSCQGLPNSLPPDLRYFLALLSTFLLFLVMGKDWLVLDVISDDRRRAFKYFVSNFGNFCTMEDLVNPVDRQKINYLLAIFKSHNTILGRSQQFRALIIFLVSLNRFLAWASKIGTHSSASNTRNVISPQQWIIIWQRDIFFIALNHIFMHLCSDITSQEKFSTLTVSQLILFSIANSI